MPVIAVVVAYQPDSMLLEQMRALRPQVAHIVVVDNGSTGPALQILQSVRQGGAEVMFLGRNMGIAAAQNAGIQMAIERQARHILLLDQDSIPEAGMVTCLKRAAELLETQGKKVACVGPRLRAGDSQELSAFARLGWLTLHRADCTDAESLMECDYLIASGSLIPVSVFRDVGRMEEELFIDQVDTEWCWRARSKGYAIYGACGAILRHRLGEDGYRIWIGRWRNLFRHKPFRYYYIFRNTIALFGRDYMPGRWVLFELRRLIVLLIAFGLVKQGAMENLRMMIRGAIDALRGVKGRLELN